MRFFEKGIGSILGLALAFLPFLPNQGFTAEDKCLALIWGGCFFILNLILPYELFETLLESIFQSEFMSIIGKWCVIGVIGYVVGRVVSGMVM